MTMPGDDGPNEVKELADEPRRDEVEEDDSPAPPAEAVDEPRRE